MRRYSSCLCRWSWRTSILLAATGLTSALFCQYFASKASQGAGTEIRRALFRHINSLSHAELDRLGTPSLITRITNDTNQVQQNIAMCIRLLTRAPFIIIGSLIMAMSINLRMSLIFFGAALLIALTLYIVMSRSVPLYAAVQKKLDKIGLISRENLSGNRVIRAFSKQNTEKARVDAATEDLTRTSVRVSKLSALLSPITYLVTDCAIIAIVWFGAVNVNAGGMKTGDIVALVSYMTQILLAMVVVANLVILMTKAGASAKRINEVFETKPSVAEINHDYISAKENTPKIEFRNVRFNYSSDGDDELSGISFTVKNGQTVGIIGGTSGTIRDNMKWQNPDASDEEINRALQIAQAAEFVDKLPNGLDSRVEQGGKNFSGGQRQRLCIARAIVSQPEILILDDSFSALDFATDAALRKALAENAKGTTVLIVTQRCSTIKNADLILVLSDGRLAGQGSHDGLFESCEVYRDICLSQLSESEVAK